MQHQKHLHHKKMMDNSKIKEVRKMLEEYVSSCRNAKELAEKMQYDKVAAKLQHDIDTAEETVQVAIAKSRFDDARRLEKTDPKKAKEVAKEAIEILQQPPQGLNEKDDLIRQIQRMMMQGHADPSTQNPQSAQHAGETDSPATDSVEEDIHKRLKAADRHTEDGNFNEALQICKDAIQISLDTHNHDMEELAKQKAKEIGWKQKFGDLDKRFDEFLEDNILLSKSKVEAAIKLVIVEEDPKSRLVKRNHETEETIHKTIAQIHEFMDATDDVEKKTDMKNKIIKRTEELNHDTYEKVNRGTPADIRHKIFIKMQLPDKDNAEEMHLYFRLKLDNILNELRRSIYDM
ncbi:MAG: hypothetical protein V1729_03730 [Candidatus Woesearchaeota archaeon]